eukprot:1346960-Pyramimonas_sp.AAC.1
MRDKARDALLTAQANMKAQYDAHKRPEEFKVGEKHMGHLQSLNQDTWGHFVTYLLLCDEVINIRYLIRHLDTDKNTSRIPIPEPEVVMDDGTIEF